VGLTVTSIFALGPSQVPVVWLTHQLVVPGVRVVGVGAVADPVPPVSELYQRRLDPVADSGDAAAPWQ
jgi:hypothetical protein